MVVAAIIAAGGSGSRLGLDYPKALAEVGGEPIVRIAAHNLAASGYVDTIVVPAPVDHLAAFRSALADYPVTTIVVPGGPTRSASVAAGLAALPDDVDIVLVHDAARPFASPELTKRVVRAVRSGHRAVVPSVPVTDTIKQIATASYAIGEPYRRPPAATAEDPVSEVIRVAYSPVRRNLRAAQTPQGFDRDLLERAYTNRSPRAAIATDDAALIEALGEEVVTVPGEESAMKITSARDLQLARIIGSEGAGDYAI